MKEDESGKRPSPSVKIGQPSPARQSWLLIFLTGSAGSIDAAIFLRSHVFTANMTGNTVILGLELAQLEKHNLVMTLAALCGFCLGVAVTARMAMVSGAKPGRSRSLNRGLSVTAGLLLAGGLAISLPSPYATVAVIALVAAAMGIQSASVQQLAVGGISTNVVTSTLTAAVTRLVSVLPLSHPGGAKAQDPRLHLSCWCSYLLGAVVGGTTSKIDLWLPLGLSILIIAVVITLTRGSAIDVD